MPQSRRPRVATAADFREFFGREPPAIWTGLVVEDDEGAIVGAGIVAWDEYGRAWGSYSARRKLPIGIMHRAAKRALSVLETVGEPALYVVCDKTIVGAEDWLQRLGFEPKPEMSAAPQYPVWVKEWQISA